MCGQAFSAHPRRGDPVAELHAGERGPSSVRERSMTATPRSAASGATPSCARRRALPVKSGGVVSACSHG